MIFVPNRQKSKQLSHLGLNILGRSFKRQAVEGPAAKNTDYDDEYNRSRDASEKKPSIVEPVKSQS
jgi:hypothetical protein